MSGSGYTAAFGPIAGLLAIAFCAPLRAAPVPGNCTAPSAECVEVGQLDISVSLGVGSRSNPVMGESDIPLVVIPQVSYYGKRFFLENLDLGVTLYEGRSNTFNLIASPGYDRVFFYRDDLQNFFVSGATGAVSLAAPTDKELEPAVEFEVRSRRTTYLAGPEWLFQYGNIVGQVDALYEVTGRNDGYEVRAAVAAPIIQSEHSLVVSGGLTWKSAEIVHYYYGVDGLYEPGSAFSPFLKLGYTRALSDRWSINAFVHYERLGSAIADSPIVSDDGVTTAFVGVVLRVL
ncbi:MAG TPA: MipA/OmpV family protein [Povalibacter sp.]|uniref:MipA/OmpV family protein n=1 Tax=Povalibacter sp. TaxID=1962978 RepID=UPI002CACBF28|nr:MipA/OmpV family protein [Povalibacter sp.]HMN44975.1 MipA/OmpV family protein [Povalibacter sp.]